MNEKVVLILKWAHAAPDSTWVNFGVKVGWSMLKTDQKWMKIGKNGLRRLILAVFKK